MIIGAEVCIGLHLPHFSSLGLHQLGAVSKINLTERFSLFLSPTCQWHPCMLCWLSGAAYLPSQVLAQCDSGAAD